MKKSYLMLGLVAAALSSCSSDDSMPVAPSENKLPGTENLEPIRLSMSTTSADVEVGTRGTGTVGSTDSEKNVWQFEDIYLLMTTNDTLCMQPIGTKAAEDGATIYDHAAWGFTSVRGSGPFLLEQFDGSFWARPAFMSSNNVHTGETKNVWELNYQVDQNEWWYQAPIDKFYPQKGASQFFAYYIDDAASNQVSTAVEATGRTNSHAYPVISDKYATITENDGITVGNATETNVANVKTVDFVIDGSQDLMAGYAKLPLKNATTSTGKTLADQDGGFSAQSARAGVVPQITMNHLLTRFTFEVVKGDANFDLVTLDGIEVISKTKGSMVVAANVAAGDDPHANFDELIGHITWDAAADTKKAVYLKQVADEGFKGYEVNANNQCVNNTTEVTFTSTSASLTEATPVYWTAEENRLYYLATTTKDVKLTDKQIATLEGLQETGTVIGGYVVNDEGKCVKEDGTVIQTTVDGVAYDVCYNATDGLYYVTTTEAGTQEVTLTEEQIATLEDLQGDAENGYTVNAENKCVTTEDEVIQYNGQDVYYVEGTGLYVINEIPETTNKNVYTPVENDGLQAIMVGNGEYVTSTAQDQANMCIDAENNPITFQSAYAKDDYNVYYYNDENHEKGLYIKIDRQVATDLPADAVWAQKEGNDIKPVVIYEKKDNTLENGKAQLIDFIPLDLSTLGLVTKKELEEPENAQKKTSASVGEAMFVSPGETEYTMNVKMTYLVRDEQNDASGEEWAEGGALTEKITLTLPLKLKQVENKDVPFQAGYSYNIKVTIYGLKEVTADVELVQWEEGEDIEVGQDDEVVNP